jgi:hypothetical protein
VAAPGFDQGFGLLQCVEDLFIQPASWHERGTVAEFVLKLAKMIGELDWPC